MSPPGRPKGEYRNALHEGTPVSGTLPVHRPSGVSAAVAWLRDESQARLVGGGTDLVALWRSGLIPQGPLVTVRSLGLDDIVLRDGHLMLGAGVRMAEAARSPLVLQHAPAVAQALLASASPQVRNMATLGGNLLQQTRCGYFRGRDAACHKLVPGSGCAVRSGEQRHAAIFGVDGPCCATHASDLAVALLALDATVRIQGADGERRVPLQSLYRAGDPTLVAGEIVTAIELPCSQAARRSLYIKVRDRASFQLAVVSLAVALECVDGKVVHARLAAGGVGTVPWRLQASEAALVGQPGATPTWQAAARAATEGAEALPGNHFKLELLQRCVAHGLQRAASHTGETS
jgi:xanthine dehydrogenase YagS FAD-binding subunit